MRGLHLLRAFQAGDVWLGNKDLAERTGMAKSTVSRLAHVLTDLGYLRRTESGAGFALGPGVLMLAYPLLVSLTVRQIARPSMKQLADAVGGQVSLGMAAGASMVFIETSRSRVHRHTRPEAGNAIPMLASSMGRAYLATLAPSRRADVLERLRADDPVGWQAHGDKVDAAVRDMIRLGFTRSFGDVRKEMVACATPLRVRIEGEPIVMNVSVPAFGLPRGALETSIGPQLCVAARRIDEAAGLEPHPGRS